MIEVYGDIWNWHARSAFIVIPVNIGWKKDGENVMGRGLAVQAVQRWPEVSRTWGRICREQGSAATATVEPAHRLIFFPTKPLNVRKPWASWTADASLPLIERSARALAVIGDSLRVPIALPLVGCGNGRLKEAVVLPTLRAALSANCFILVRRRA